LLILKFIPAGKLCRETKNKFVFKEKLCYNTYRQMLAGRAFKGDVPPIFADENIRKFSQTLNIFGLRIAVKC